MTQLTVYPLAYPTGCTLATVYKTHGDIGLTITAPLPTRPQLVPATMSGPAEAPTGWQGRPGPLPRGPPTPDGPGRPSTVSPSRRGVPLGAVVVTLASAST